MKQKIIHSNGFKSCLLAHPLKDFYLFIQQIFFEQVLQTSIVLCVYNLLVNKNPRSQNKNSKELIVQKQTVNITKKLNSTCEGDVCYAKKKKIEEKNRGQEYKSKGKCQGAGNINKI